LVLPLFAVTLFTSAFLLFLVQPIIGALILPKLGGTPQVWNTCMVFFQTVLLAGYAYTHMSSTWLPTKRQVLVHCALLFLPLLVLILLPAHGPFDVSQFKPLGGANPIPVTLLLLITVVGLPFFVVATSAPLLQKWFASTGHPSAQDPYFLYAASNFGSMLGLLSYPAIVEPFFGLHATEAFNIMAQPWLWTVGYLIMMVLFFACAAVVLLSPKRVQLAGVSAPKMLATETSESAAAVATPERAAAQATAVTAAPPAVKPKQTAIKKGSKQGKNRRPQPLGNREPIAAKVPPRAAPIATVPASEEVTPGRRLRWVALAAVPSSLMLGVCTFMSTDISAIPLFWVLPLTLYLLSFILVFLRWPEPWVGTPHRLVLMIQPAALLVLVYVTLVHMDPSRLLLTVGLILATFFLTALACHGELAKDRPPTKHLTEFYLWMSVGGMVGGMFNALLAPVLIPNAIEFSMALVVAGLVLPWTKRSGWTDDYLIQKEARGVSQPHRPGPRGAGRRVEEPAPSRAIHTVLDIALPVGLFFLGLVLLVMSDSFVGAFESIGRAIGLSGDTLVSFMSVTTKILTLGVPLVIVFLYAGRPLRYGLGIGAVLLASGIHSWFTDQTSLYTDRSYYSIIRVNRYQEYPNARDERRYGTYTSLMHATTLHGVNFSDPPELRRLATTYYHRASPVGYVMEKMMWFHEPKLQTTTDPKTGKRKFLYVYWSDARMPASLVGLGAAPLGVGNLPIGQLVGFWSEPAYATVGLGTGTMAVYGHPFQCMDFYEIDRHIRDLSLPPPNRPYYFTNVKMALERGVNLHVLMGDARLRMAQPWTPSWEPDHWEKTGGPDHFYTALIVDAFSSDAIPIHLITKEAFQLYFSKLTEKGILCMHTSNRYVDLVRVCGDLARDLGYAWRRGHTNEPRLSEGEEDPGHGSSEWVMIARRPEYLDADPPIADLFNPNEKTAPHWVGLAERNDPKYWSDVVYWDAGSYVWTDDHHNILSVFTPLVGGNRGRD
jgi:hypothetical protein